MLDRILRWIKAWVRGERTQRSGMALLAVLIGLGMCVGVVGAMGAGTASADPMLAPQSDYTSYALKYPFTGLTGYTTQYATSTQERIGNWTLMQYFFKAEISTTGQYLTYTLQTSADCGTYTTQATVYMGPSSSISPGVQANAIGNCARVLVQASASGASQRFTPTVMLVLK